MALLKDKKHFKNIQIDSLHEVSLEDDITFRLFNQLSLDILFDMKLSFGHILMEWKDSNKVFGLAAVNQRCVFNLENTILGFRRAFLFLSKAITSYRRNSIMFVSGLPKYDNFNDFLNFHKTQMPLLGYGYVIHWIPGILTNFAMLLSTFWKRTEILLPRYSKQEKREWFLESVRGIKLLHTFPDFVCFFSTAGIYEIAIKEALRLKIPTVAFVDSDQEVENITFPIVGNDDSFMGLEIKIYLFRELILRCLKKFLFTEIEQLLIERSALQQLIFQNYLSDRFIELLKHSKTQIFLRMQQKTQKQVQNEDRLFFKQRKLFLLKGFFDSLCKMSGFFFKKLLFNKGFLKKKFKRDKKIFKKNYKIIFFVVKSIGHGCLKIKSKKKKQEEKNKILFFNFENNNVRKLKLFNYKLMFCNNSYFNANNDSLPFFEFKNETVKVRKYYFFKKWFLFVKHFFILSMFFNFIFSSKVFFTKEQLKLHWLFFVFSDVLKEKYFSKRNILHVFLNYISFYKNLFNFCGYYIQYRKSFFSEVFTSLLRKNKNFSVIVNFVKEGFVNIEKKVALKNLKHLNLNFIFHFINPIFIFTNFFFSKTFYYNWVLNFKYRNKVFFKKSILPNKILKKNKKKSKFKNKQLVNIKNFGKYIKNTSTFRKLMQVIYLNKGTVEPFLARHLIFWKIYKLQRRRFIMLEKRLQKDNTVRLLLFKFTTIFNYFPSLRSFFLRRYKYKYNRCKPSFWFKFKLKKSLIFFIKKKNAKLPSLKFKYRHLLGFSRRFFPNKFRGKYYLKKKKSSNLKKNMQVFFKDKFKVETKNKQNVKPFTHFFFHNLKKIKTRFTIVPFLFTRYFRWLKDKPALSFFFPKFVIPKYPITPFYNLNDLEFNTYHKNTLPFFFDFLNYIQYKKKLLNCFVDFKLIVKKLLYQQYKYKFFELVFSKKHLPLSSFFRLLQNTNISKNSVDISSIFLVLFSKLYNLIFVELNVLLKKEDFNSFVYFLFFLRFFYYIQKIANILKLDKSFVNSFFLQLKLRFFSFGDIYKNNINSYFFLSKNLVNSFFIYLKNNSRKCKKLFSFLKKIKTKKKKILQQKLYNNNLILSYYDFLKLARRQIKFRKLYKKYQLQVFSIFARKSLFQNVLNKKYSRLNFKRLLFRMFFRFCHLIYKTKFLSNNLKKNPIVYFPGCIKIKRNWRRCLIPKFYSRFATPFLNFVVNIFSSLKLKKFYKSFCKISKLKTKNYYVYNNIYKKKNIVLRKKQAVSSFFRKTFCSKFKKHQNISKSSFVLLLKKKTKKILTKNKYKSFNLKKKVSTFVINKKITATSLFNLRILRRNRGFPLRYNKKLKKKKETKLNFLESIWFFKNKFRETKFFKDWCAPNIYKNMKVRCLNEPLFYKKVPKLLFRHVLHFNFKKTLGFLVKINSYKINFFKEKKKKVNFIFKSKKTFNYNLFKLPIVPKAPKETHAADKTFFASRVFFHRHFGRQVSFNFKDTKFFNVRFNFKISQNFRLSRDGNYFINGLGIHNKKLRLKVNTLGFIFKKFKFYFQKLKFILFNIFYNNNTFNSFDIFENVFTKFEVFKSNEETSSLFFSLLKQSFYFYLYRLYIDLKYPEISFLTPIYVGKKEKLIRKRIGVRSHFSFLMGLNYENFLQKYKSSNILYLFFKLKKAREFYFLKYSKFINNQNLHLRRGFNKKTFRFLKIFY